MKLTLLTTGLLTFVLTTAFIKLEKTNRFKNVSKTLKEQYGFVPGGKVILDGDTSSVQAFYMSKGEVTNGEYMEFLSDLLANNKQKEYEIAKIDTMGWEKMFKCGMAKYTSFYHDHSAYFNHPVVNISYEGAQLYCEWLSGKMEKESNGKIKLKFRIPNREEWLRAANGDNHHSIYSWGGPYLSNSKGHILANFTRLGAENITRNNDKLEVIIAPNSYYFNAFGDLTAPVKSYWPNQFDLYCLNGNVSEMIAEKGKAVGGDWNSPGYDVRNESIKDFEASVPTVGFRVVATYVSDSK